MPRLAALLGLLLALAVVAGGGGSGPSPARALVYTPADVMELIADINAANATPAADVIDLGGNTFTLNAVHNMTDGPNGLPPIADAVTAGSLTIQDGTIRRMGATEFRMLHVGSGADLTLDRVTIALGGAVGDTFPDQSGGAILNHGTVTVVDSTLSRNNAASGAGGAVANLAGSTLTILRSTLVSNTAPIGGGIYNAGGATLINATLSMHTAGMRGAGIYNDDTGVLALTNSTLWGNSSSMSGGGIYNDGDSSPGGMITTINTIVAGSLVGGNCDTFGAPATWEGMNNVSDDDTCPGPVFTQGDDALGMLQDNGGLTETHLPGPTSDAIGAGDQATCDAISPNVDQRGLSRTSGSRCDIGAVEIRGLTITKTGALTSAPGEQFTYTITIANGPDQHSGPFTFEDPLPSGVAFVGMTPLGDACGHNLGLVTCATAGLHPNTSLVITITVRVLEPPAAGDGDVLTNTARAVASGGGVLAVSNTVETRVEFNAEVLLTKHAEPGIAAPGGTVTYTLSLTNAGDPALAGELVDPLPAGVTLVATGAPPGWSCAGATVVTCTSAGLGTGETAVFVVTVQVDSGTAPGPLTNTAVGTLTTTGGDVTGEAEAILTVVDPDLVVTKTGPLAAPPGGAVTYLVTVANLGPGTAFGVVLTDTLLGGGSLTGFEAPDGVSCPGNSCGLGDLAPGAAVTLWVHTVAPPTSGASGMLNEACAFAATPERDTANNCDTAATSVIAGAATPGVPAVGPGQFQPPPASPTAMATATETPESSPTETATPEPSATPTSEPTQTPTATNEPSPSPSPVETPDTGSGAGGETPAATTEAPRPPDAGSGGLAGSRDAGWLVLLGIAILVVGAGVVAHRGRVPGRSR